MTRNVMAQLNISFLLLELLRIAAQAALHGLPLRITKRQSVPIQLPCTRPAHRLPLHLSSGAGNLDTYMLLELSILMCQILLWT
jgi:hypothetical protein